MSLIRAVYARPIYSGPGSKTVEVDVALHDGSFGRASLPAGVFRAAPAQAAPTSSRNVSTQAAQEPIQPVLRLINETVSVGLADWDALDQPGLDSRLVELFPNGVSTVPRSALTLAVSAAVARAAARSTGQTFTRYLGGWLANLLPVTWFHLTESSLYNRLVAIEGTRGGERESGAALSTSNLPGLTILALPLGMPNYAEAVRCGGTIYQQMEQAVVGATQVGLVGPNGGWVTAGQPIERLLESVVRAIERAGFRPGQEVMLALDLEAERRFVAENGTYQLDGNQLEPDAWLASWTAQVQKFPIAALLDNCRSGDPAAGQLAMARLGNRLQLVRDTLVDTESTVRPDAAATARAAPAALLGTTQRLSCARIASLTEFFQRTHQAQSCGHRLLFCHGAGETEDPLIAELAVALRAGQLLAGAPSRGEFLAKYNQLLRIGEELGRHAVFDGRSGSQST